MGKRVNDEEAVQTYAWIVAYAPCANMQMTNKKDTDRNDNKLMDQV